MRGNPRKGTPRAAFAAGMLAAFLLLAVPGSSLALEEDSGQTWLEEVWHDLCDWIGSLDDWGPFIIPEA